MAQSLLLGADGFARARADHAVGRADVVAACQQQGLQFAVLCARQAGVVGGPGLHEADWRAGRRRDQVGQLRDGQAVVLAGVVAVQRVEVAADQEGRAAARRHHQAGAGQAVGQGRAVHQRQAGGAPGGDGALGLAAGAGRAVAGGQAHLEAPGFAAAVAGVLQKLGGGGQRVGHGVDDVAPAVAVEVDRAAEEGAGHELRLPEGAGP